MKIRCEQQPRKDTTPIYWIWIENTKFELTELRWLLKEVKAKGFGMVSIYQQDANHVALTTKCAKQLYHKLLIFKTLIKRVK